MKDMIYVLAIASGLGVVSLTVTYLILELMGAFP